ncbi:Haloacid dehalogenase-like hydrolase domain-containing protein 2, partial [Linnemannia exigua]
MQSIRGVLIDVSGTVHVGDKVIPGAVQALDRLRASGIPFRFCTNTTQYSGDTLANKLRKLGFNVKREEMNKALKILLATIPSSVTVTGIDTGVAAATGVPRLIAVHKAKYFADKDQTDLSMGPGGFVQALEFATGVQAHVVGK